MGGTTGSIDGTIDAGSDCTGGFKTRWGIRAMLRLRRTRLGGTIVDNTGKSDDGLAGATRAGAASAAVS